MHYAAFCFLDEILLVLCIVFRSPGPLFCFTALVRLLVCWTALLYVSKPAVC